ncbi:MAG: class I SAM-dependent methyltransferase [Phyllobacterium sp.]
MTNGWNESAKAWIADMGENGDFAREFVLDPAIRPLIENRNFANALDVGCGEGRFCRFLQTLGISPTGIDPTEAFLQQARLKDPDGDYRSGQAERLGFPDESFDLVVSYLTLIDIDDAEKAIAEMARVLKPSGTLLVANLNAFITAGNGENLGWQKDETGVRQFYAIDDYLQTRANWMSWRDIRIRNWHRPLSAYMAHFLKNGLQLRHFSEPAPVGGPDEKQSICKRIPYFVLMEWEKNT